MTETKRKVKQISVRIVKATQENTIVEFMLGGLLQRATIPTVEVHNEKVSDDVLLAGIPYGTPWEFLDLKTTSIQLANALRMAGIWSYENAVSKPNVVISALQAAYGVDLAALLKFARENK